MTDSPAPSLAGDELRELLVAGAREDILGVRAAVHLVVFTELPNSARFAGHVAVGDFHSFSGGTTTQVARVRDWDALLADEGLLLSGTERRLLDLAASLAVGRPVNLRDALSNQLGWAHVKRAVEAFLLATDTSGLLAVTETAGIGGVRGLHATLSGDPLP